MNKKNLILIALIIVFLGGIGVFFLLNRQAPSQNLTTSNTNNPFGNTGNSNVSGNQGNTYGNNLSGSTNILSVTNDSGAVIEKIVPSQVAGYTFIGTGTSTVIRYVERGTGQVDDVAIAAPSNVSQKVYADTQSRIILAYFLNQGKDLIRFKENDDGTASALYSLLAASSTNGSSTSIPGTILYFDTNITGTRGLFVTQNGDGATVSIANSDGSGVKALWNSALQEITAQGLNKDLVAVENKPAYGFSGAVFLIKSGIPQYYLGGNSGFKALLSPDSKWAIFSDYTNNLSPISIFNSSQQNSTGLYIQTLPEKCVWSKINSGTLYCFEFGGQHQNLPDSWYLGNTYLDNTRLWEISVTNEKKTVLADFTNVNEPVDATNLNLSSDEKYLGFINKHDNSLWLIDLSAVKSF